jgi:hypothetical protein
VLQSIRPRGPLRQAVWPRKPARGRRWSWLVLGGHPFRHTVSVTLWLAVVLLVVVVGLPTMRPPSTLTLTQLFQNPTTRAILQAMKAARLPLARGVVTFLRSFALAHGDGGDTLIQWDALGTSDYNDGTQMYLNGAAFDPHNPYTLASYAGQITHEAVEIYFAQADGVPGNTLPMDYLAEYEGGLVMRAVAEVLQTKVPMAPGTGTGQIDTVGRSYADWLTNGNERAYHEASDAGTWWHFLWWSGPLEDHAQFGNPMGLSLAMLRWETRCGNETLPDWQVRGCA